jgi:hypothetical protein
MEPIPTIEKSAVISSFLLFIFLGSESVYIIKKLGLRNCSFSMAVLKLLLFSHVLF